jgi:hypothetical protein
VLAVAGFLEVEELWTEDLAPQFEAQVHHRPGGRSARARLSGRLEDRACRFAERWVRDSRSVPVERRRELLIPQDRVPLPPGTTS